MPPLPPPGLGAPAVLERIAAAAARAGRDPSAVTLVAAAKTVEPDRIVAAGVADVGENRVQELAAKQEALAEYAIRWHFIGRLQRNKVKAVAGRVALVHSVDSVELAHEIGRRAAEAGAVQPILIQVNVSGEASKGGVPVAEAPAVVDAVRAVEGIEVRGLMTIPAPGDEAASRAAFRTLEAAAAALGLSELSMGMSGDFEVAVEEGATIVRVGTAIYGPRPPAGGG
ncbi:MAG TPA: YggS family pyridoxal phosphate-dependent enzyme [Actinomycetota bacterium]|nr:YggS family pyridoxal phosphate-dependent enzyme [Actinomycetota bacterium]